MTMLEQFATLRRALTDAIKCDDSLAGELRVMRTEREMLKE